jgi:hypothetical protein
LVSLRSWARDPERSFQKISNPLCDFIPSRLHNRPLQHLPRTQTKSLVASDNSLPWQNHPSSHVHAPASCALRRRTIERSPSPRPILSHSRWRPPHTICGTHAIQATMASGFSRHTQCWRPCCPESQLHPSPAPPGYQVCDAWSGWGRGGRSWPKLYTVPSRT